MTFANARFRNSRVRCAFLASCAAVLTAVPLALSADSPFPAAPADDVLAAEARLGGERSLSPALVPNSILSLDIDPAGDEPLHVARAGDLREPRAVPKGLASPAPRQVTASNDSPGANDSPSTRLGGAAEQEPPTVPLSPAELATRRRVRDVLEAYESWRLNSRDHSPWEIMHAIIAGGVSTQILQGGPGGEPVTAIGWLCFNRPAAGRRLFYPTRDGFATQQGPGLEGHRGQLLAILAQAQVKPDYPIELGGRTFAISDLIEYEKRTCYARTELTFKLIALNHYLEQDARWESERGESWDIPRLIREEIAQPVRGAPCGGTHRLTGLSLAVKKRIASGRPLDGEYARAARYIRDYHAYTFSLQNRDGSFSTQWFGGRGADRDPARRVQTTGHILEWLCYSLSSSEIRDPRVRAAADHLAGILWAHRGRTWDNGPLGHALHALVLYNERALQSYDATVERLSSTPSDAEAPLDR